MLYTLKPKQTLSLSSFPQLMIRRVWSCLNELTFGERVLMFLSLSRYRPNSINELGDESNWGMVLALVQDRPSDGPRAIKLLLFGVSSCCCCNTPLVPCWGYSLSLTLSIYTAKLLFFLPSLPPVPPGVALRRSPVPPSPATRDDEAARFHSPSPWHTVLSAHSCHPDVCVCHPVSPKVFVSYRVEIQTVRVRNASGKGEHKPFAILPQVWTYSPAHIGIRVQVRDLVVKDLWVIF